MRHPKNRLQRFNFLIRNQKKSKEKYVWNCLIEYRFNLKKMVDKEWEAYIQYLKDREEEMRNQRTTKPIKVS